MSTETDPNLEIDVNNLSDEEQVWLQSAVDTSVTYQRELWASSELEALEAVKKAGVEVIRPDKSPFKNKVSDMYKEYKDDIPVYNLIKRIQEVE